MNARVAAPMTDPSSSDRPAAESPRHRGLFSDLSREMCRPLISLRAGFDLLLAGSEGPISDQQREQVRTLRGQCDDLIGLSRTYLDYAALACGPRPLDLDRFALGVLLAEADRQFAAKAHARGIGWACRVEGEDAMVVTDLACFQQILGRLATNALAHTPDEGRIEVTGRADGDDWVVEVVDDGRGIPAQALGRVFDPLVRLGHAYGPSSCPSQGHGMGLAVCRELVARLGGEITLISQPDCGTTVSVRFPKGVRGD